MTARAIPALPICIDEYLAGERYDEVKMPSPVDPRSTNRDELALARYSLWEPGQILRIRFLDGEEELRELVEAHAREWLLYANIQFEFGNFPDAVIRVTFKGSGYRSLVGTDATKRPDPEPTMTLGGFSRRTDDLEVQRVVLHEFGHALGCIHEQANPTIKIPWDKEKVYAYYKAHAGWSKARVDLNVLKRYSKSQVRFTQHDPQSIMQYPVPNELTRGDFEIGWNNTLSETDKVFIQAMYP
jgi:hypothetical protein